MPSTFHYAHFMKSSLLLLIFLIGSKVQALGLGIAPARFELVIQPGTHTRQVIRVANFDNQKKLALTVSVADWRLDAQGKVVVDAPGSMPRSAAAWINFSPASLLLKPKEGKQIILDIRVPAKLELTQQQREYRVAILVDTVLPPEAERKKKSGIWHKYQVSSLLYFSFPSFTVKPMVKSLQTVSAENEPALKLDLHNAGNVHVRLAGELTLTDSGGNIAHRHKLKNIVLLEQQDLSKTLPLELPAALAPGAYRVKLSLQGQDPEKVQVPVRFGEDFSPLILELPQ